MFNGQFLYSRKGDWHVQISYPNIHTFCDLGEFLLHSGAFFMCNTRELKTLFFTTGHMLVIICAGEPGQISFFTTDILCYHSDIYFQFRSLVKINLLVSLFMFSSSAIFHSQLTFFNLSVTVLTSRSVYMTQNL